METHKKGTPKLHKDIEIKMTQVIIGKIELDLKDDDKKKAARDKLRKTKSVLCLAEPSTSN